MLLALSELGCGSAAPSEVDAIDAGHAASTRPDASRAPGSTRDARVVPGARDAGAADADTASDASSAAEPREPLRVTVLRDVTLASGTHYQLLRLQRGQAPASYAQWFPPKSATPRPVVLITKPYDGIDWTGEEVDARWAAHGSGLQPDVDAPPAASGMPSSIAYELLSPDLADDGALYRLHDFGALLVYGRFYAGGDVQNDIDDMTLGFDFLAVEPTVDRSRIGIWGGSWGGFEALYGAAFAAPAVRPKVGAALAPVSDFEVEHDFVTRELPARYVLPSSDHACAAFFDPYLRRIDQTTQARGGFEGLRAEDLAARIEAPFLLVHEDWDTLVSFEQSKRLVELAPRVFAPLWLLHDAPPFSWDLIVNDHGPLLRDFGSSAALTFITAHLLRHLGDAEQPLQVFWEGARMRALFEHMRGRQRAGVDIAFFAARLRELCDKRMLAFDPAVQPSVPLRRALAAALGAAWGKAYTEQSVCEELELGLPAP